MKWLIYTVLVGLIPIMSRVLVWVITPPGTINVFAASDFIAFGLILHISNINEIEHLNNDEKSWKTIQNGTSIVFIALYCVLFSSLMFGEGAPNSIDIQAIQWSVMILAGISFGISFAVFHRISNIQRSGSVQ